MKNGKYHKNYTVGLYSNKVSNVTVLITKHMNYFQISGLSKNMKTRMSPTLERKEYIYRTNIFLSVHQLSIKVN
jgi:hypothetical protein